MTEEEKERELRYRATVAELRLDVYEQSYDRGRRAGFGSGLSVGLAIGGILLALIGLAAAGFRESGSSPAGKPAEASTEAKG